MEQVILTVPDISCAHCERTVTNALSPVAGVQSVAVNIGNREVQVEYDPAQVTVAQMQDILQEEDYPVTSAKAGSLDPLSVGVSDTGSTCSCCS